MVWMCMHVHVHVHVRVRVRVRVHVHVHVGERWFCVLMSCILYVVKSAPRVRSLPRLP